MQDFPNFLNHVKVMHVCNCLKKYFANIRQLSGALGSRPRAPNLTDSLKCSPNHNPGDAADIPSQDPFPVINFYQISQSFQPFSSKSKYLTFQIQLRQFLARTLIDSCFQSKIECSGDNILCIFILVF